MALLFSFVFRISSHSPRSDRDSCRIRESPRHDPDHSTNTAKNKAVPGIVGGAITAITKGLNRISHPSPSNYPTRGGAVMTKRTRLSSGLWHHTKRLGLPLHKHNRVKSADATDPFDADDAVALLGRVLYVIHSLLRRRRHRASYVILRRIHARARQVPPALPLRSSPGRLTTRNNHHRRSAAARENRRVRNHCLDRTRTATRERKCVAYGVAFAYIHYICSKMAFFPRRMREN